MQYDVNLNIAEKRLIIDAETPQPATLVDWLLVLQDLEVHIKVLFAQRICEVWSEKNGLDGRQKMFFMKEMDRLSGPHPNAARHDDDLNNVLSVIYEKLELKKNLEQLN